MCVKYREVKLIIRNNISYAAHEIHLTMLFKGTIRENLMLAKLILNKREETCNE